MVPPFSYEGPCKILDFYLAKVLQGLFCDPGKGVRIMEKNKANREIDLTVLSLSELDAIAQESYVEMLRLVEAGEAGGVEYLRASVRYAQAAIEFYRRVNAAELIQKFNLVSDVFGMDVAADVFEE